MCQMSVLTVGAFAVENSLLNVDGKASFLANMASIQLGEVAP